MSNSKRVFRLEQLSSDHNNLRKKALKHFQNEIVEGMAGYDIAGNFLSEEIFKLYSDSVRKFFETVFPQVNYDVTRRILDCKLSEKTVNIYDMALKGEIGGAIGKLSRLGSKISDVPADKWPDLESKIVILNVSKFSDYLDNLLGKRVDRVKAIQNAFKSAKSQIKEHGPTMNRKQIELLGASLASVSNEIEYALQLIEKLESEQNNKAFNAKVKSFMKLGMNKDMATAAAKIS